MNKILLLLLAGTAFLSAQSIPGRYIVEFDTAPAALSLSVPRARFSAGDPAVVQRRAQITAQHNEMEQTVRALGGSVRRRFDTVFNGMAVDLSEQAAAQLQRMPGVRGVYPDRIVQKHLDHAVNVHQVADAWNLMTGGQTSAGAGIKIGILDTGIDVTHPAFQGFSTALPDGFPKFSSDAEAANTNNKVIVSRDYTGAGALDTDGHGTGNAMVAAGLTYDPATYGIGPFSGFAPGAWLGNYAIFGTTTTLSTVLQAFQDAVVDGMNIVNMSGGFTVLSANDENGPISRVIDAMVAAGTLVVVSAGNAGPDAGTLGSPAVVGSAIAVGSNFNERTFADGVSLGDVGPFPAAAPNSSSTFESVLTGPMADVSQIDGNGFGCSPFPADSLSGKIALISRSIVGSTDACPFDNKVNNAQNAGAIGAVVYDSRPNELVTMSLPTATLPALFVTQDAGQQMKDKLAAQADAVALVDFSYSTPFAISSDYISFVSSGGPTPSGGVKPDLMAVGQDVATASTTQNGSAPWQVTAGTSLSAPMVTGALAALMSARPGLTAAQYRSLVVNSAKAFLGSNGAVAPPQIVGGGKLNLLRALQNTATAEPSVINFKTGARAVSITKKIVVTNVGTATDTFTITVNPLNTSGPVPTTDVASITLDPGASNTLAVQISASNPDPGQYHGYVTISGTKNDVVTSIPYWLGVPGTEVKGFAFLQEYDFVPSAPGDQWKIYFRTTDLTGLPIGADTPTVTTTSPRARVLGVTAVGDIPGTYRADIVVGRADSQGVNVFTFAAGSATRDLTFVVQ
jgi:minor extracellular serine protease Vpr